MGKRKALEKFVKDHTDEELSENDGNIESYESDYESINLAQRKTI